MRKKIVIKKTALFVSCALALLIAAAGILWLRKAPLSQDQSKRYNVILVVADALRHDILGCYGGKADTPNIDWLSENGVTFKRAYATAPCTMPSSVSMFTGNYSMSYGAIPAKDLGEKTVWGYFYYVPNAEPLLGKSLRKLGYRVNMSIENPNAWGSNNLQGFVKLPKKKDLSVEDTAHVEKITGIKNLNRNKNGRVSSRYNDCYGMLHYLLHHETQENFFMIKWFQDPHSPYNPPEKFKTRIILDAKDLPDDETYYTSQTSFELKSLTEAELEFVKELYRAEVESIDERIGYILRALEHQSLLEETYVVLTSDHGEMFGEHGRMSHGGAFYEELLRVPLIIFGPSIQPGSTIEAYVSLLDLMPSLKELLGVKYRDNTQGESWLPLLLGKSNQDRVLYFDRMNMKLEPGKIRKDKAIIMDGYKLILNFRRNKRIFSLFDLANDPHESENIYNQRKEMADIMYQEILERSQMNEKSREIARKQTAAEIDFKEMSEENIEKLRALGYIK